MRVSVAMCTFNGARFLRKQLNSIAKQSMLPDELIICDDGSTDATPEIVADFGHTAPLEVNFIPNAGRLGSTRNFEKALSLCRGRLIALADQDDVWDSQKLAGLTTVLEANPDVGGVFSDAELIDESSQSIGHRLWNRKHFHPKGDSLSADQMIDILLRHNVVTGATMMIRKDLLNILLPVGDQWIHDGWFAWMLVLYSKLGFVRTPLTYYRMHGSQQVGADSHSIRKVFVSGRHAGDEQFVNFARQFEVLYQRWEALPGPDFARRRIQFEGKIRHMYMRAQLPQNPLARGMTILRSPLDYKRYSNGVASMIRDLVIS